MENHSIEPVPSRRKKLGWFGRTVLFFNWFFAIALLAGNLAPLVSPARVWSLAFLGLIQPVLFVICIIFLIYWGIRRKRHVLISAVIVLLSLVHFGKQCQVRLGQPDQAPTNSFRMLSWNVKLFDLYNWSGNTTTRSKMLDLLKNQNADLLCLQEFYTEDTGARRNMDTIKALLKYPYSTAAYTITLRQKDHWGVATFSRFPIVNSGKIVFNNRSNNICLYTDLVIDGDTVRVYNMHLQSINFGYSDLHFVETVLNEEQAEDEIANSKSILRRMKRAYTRRAEQSNAIAAHMASCPYPRIVCGDFNDTPVSYTYRTISEGLRDAFRESGSGFGKTLNIDGGGEKDWASRLPFPRIDYIFTSVEYSSWEFETIHADSMSDHYPITCKIGKE